MISQRLMVEHYHVQYNIQYVRESKCFVVRRKTHNQTIIPIIENIFSHYLHSWWQTNFVARAWTCYVIFLRYVLVHINTIFQYL